MKYPGCKNQFPSYTCVTTCAQYEQASYSAPKNDPFREVYFTSDPTLWGSCLLDGSGIFNGLECKNAPSVLSYGS